ncbi:DNA/RNA non-specific endonuclease [Photobacterium swingsii]|uniref:DNA/RNA non-specific endonuclease n=1 Tax=Photobacterium swingsii TaxID=680026 RepID=UPI00352CE247
MTKALTRAIGIDRGHQVPLASVCGTDSWAQANYLSNITPQSSELNQGPWKNLEEKVRKIVKEGNDVYVLTGLLYEKEMPSLPNTDEPHIIPSGYWKIIAIQDDKFINTASFIMEQDSKRKDNFCDKRVKLSEVQKRSELFIFPSLPIDHKVTEKLFDKNFVGS